LNLPDSSRANLFSPLASLPASVIIPSRISHIDLCLAMTFTGQQRIIYVNESLQLAADESEPLASSDNVSDDHLLMQSIYIFILARMKAALITWGLAEDIFALSDRRLSLYDCLCSGDRHYISRVIISAVDEKASEYSDLYDAILNWRPEICAPGVIANLLQQYPSNFEDIILPPDLRLFFNRSKLVSTRIRNFFHLNSSLYLSNSDLLLNSTCMRLQSFSQPSVAREN
jgi:hypothetical protein